MPLRRQRGPSGSREGLLSGRAQCDTPVTRAQPRTCFFVSWGYGRDAQLRGNARCASNKLISISFQSGGRDIPALLGRCRPAEGCPLTKLRSYWINLAYAQQSTLQTCQWTYNSPYAAQQLRTVPALKRNLAGWYAN